MKRINFPEIPEEDRTPVINVLLKIIEHQHHIIEKLEPDVSSLKDEVKRLKKHPKKPKIKPSKMDKDDRDGKGGTSGTKPLQAGIRNKFPHKREVNI